MTPACFKLADDVAVLIPIDGPVVDIKTPTLEDAQAMVEGYVEAVWFMRDSIGGQALVNEDGLLKQMKPNLRASLLVGRGLVGPVIILTGKRRWA